MNCKKILLMAIGLLLLTGCPSGPFDCDTWANGYRDNSEANIVLNKIKQNGTSMYLYGSDVVTGKPTEFYEGSGWISEIHNQFNIGDTIIKKKGSYLTTIRRKNKIIVIPLTCDETGKVYKDK
jgi:hypothetical protein